MSKKQVNVRNTCEKLHQKYRKLNNPVIWTKGKQLSLNALVGGISNPD